MLGVGFGFGSAGSALDRIGSGILRENPILIKQWEATTSMWTGRGGFSDGLKDLLTENGIQINGQINPAPAGSLGKNSGVPLSIANNTNGQLASEAIAQRWKSQGFKVATEVSEPKFNRRIDVVVQIPATDSRYNQKLEIESKVGYTRPSTSRVATELAADAAALRSNMAIRDTGITLLEKGAVFNRIGKVVKPLGIAMDAYEMAASYRADGYSVGVNTGRSASGLVGGGLGAWGGAAAGAALGSVVPVVGTAVGAVIGGIIGGFGGDMIGRGLFDWSR
jgi:hypothetical protein